MEIPKDLKDQIWEYCRLNDITDLNAFMLKSLQQGFNVIKYGPTPFTIEQKEPEIIEKEVIKEVEVEVIKEIEKIVEVPVEVIKEVEKIVEVTVTDNELIDKLQEELENIKSKLTTSLDEKNVEIELLNRKISDLNDQIVQQQEEFTNNNLVKQLKQQVENLKIELELEKNRNYVPPKKERVEEPTQRRGMFNNIISWVSKDEREDNDPYGE